MAAEKEAPGSTTVTSLANDSGHKRMGLHMLKFQESALEP
jgi:hypothetical protein